MLFWRGPDGRELTEKRNCVPYAIATTSGFMSVLSAVVAADWSELVLKGFREDYFATDIDQSVAKSAMASLSFAR